MALTAGVVTKVSQGSTVAKLQTTAASGSTGPYTQQWYKSTVTGFTPGAGNIIAGATGLTLNDSGLIPGTNYFYKVVYADAVSGTIIGSQQAVTSDSPNVIQNTFGQGLIVGMPDLRMNYNTVSVQIDSSQVGNLYPGAAVKVVDSAGGVPKVVACTANSDEVWGFIMFDTKSQRFLPGDMAEISMAGNVMYLYATGPISRGARVQLDLTTNGGVAALVGSSGADVVGYAYDKAVTAGALIRVHVSVPSFVKA